MAIPPSSFSISMLTGALSLSDLRDKSRHFKKEDFLTLQRFSFDCTRALTPSGEAYSASGGVISATVRMMNPDSYKEFYERLGSTEQKPMSFIFDASFSAGELSSCEGGIVVEGYVVDIEESYHADTDKQMLLTFRFRFTSLTFLGENNNGNVTFSIY